MKKIVVMIMFCVSTSALANDGGMAYIDVQRIAPNGASDGTTIEFSGKDAANFMKLLPEFSNTLYSMVRPDVAEKLQENERGVALFSKGWGLMINCEAGYADNLDQDDPKKIEFVPSTPTCRIELTRSVTKDDLGGASWSMEPKNYRNEMCSQ